MLLYSDNSRQSCADASNKWTQIFTPARMYDVVLSFKVQ